VLERVLGAPPETVHAWTEPRLLEKWFRRRPWMAAECEIDLRPGGTFLQGPDGTTLDNLTTALGPGYRPQAR
jgi:uncharacterized protein YndB with AHSA1/START domain